LPPLQEPAEKRPEEAAALRPLDPAAPDADISPVAAQGMHLWDTAAPYGATQGTVATRESEGDATDRDAGWDDSWDAALEAGGDHEPLDTEWTMPALSEDEQRFNEEAMAAAIALLAQEFNLIR
jgi:hypothetical protein